MGDISRPDSRNESGFNVLKIIQPVVNWRNRKAYRPCLLVFALVLAVSPLLPARPEVKLIEAPWILRFGKNLLVVDDSMDGGYLKFQAGRNNGGVLWAGKH